MGTYSDYEQRLLDQQSGIEGDRREEHRRRVLAHQEDSRWLGTHSRPEPDHNGWTEFEVYRFRNQYNGVVTFYWAAVNDDGAVGFEHGPFATAKEAHDDAWGGG
jgi:hypothetical protein